LRNQFEIVSKRQTVLGIHAASVSATIITKGVCEVRGNSSHTHLSFPP
jgi:hypothetical protein